jgi:ABC-type uncharacterized transport system auxiliary subunit
MMAKRTLVRAALLAALAIAAGACGAVPEKRFYAMVNEPVPGGPPGPQATCIRTVVVSQPEIAVPYDNDRIVFRTDDYEVKYFNYDLWVSRPQDMIQQLVARRIEGAHLFAAVDPQLEGARERFTLLTAIDALEMVVKENVVEARLAISFRLQDTAIDQVVWRHGFDVRRPVPAKGREVRVGEMIRTVNAVYNTELEGAVRALGAFVQSYPGCRPAP